MALVQAFLKLLFPEQFLSFVILMALTTLQQLYGASWTWQRYTPHGKKSLKVVCQQIQNLTLEVYFGFKRILFVSLSMTQHYDLKHLRHHVSC